MTITGRPLVVIVAVKFVTCENVVEFVVNGGLTSMEEFDALSRTTARVPVAKQNLRGTAIPENLYADVTVFRGLVASRQGSNQPNAIQVGTKLGTTKKGRFHIGPNLLVRKGGVEPPWVSPPDPKSGASASSATFAGLKRTVLQFNGSEQTTASTISRCLALLQFTFGPCPATFGQAKSRHPAIFPRMCAPSQCRRTGQNPPCSVNRPG